MNHDLPHPPWCDLSLCDAGTDRPERCHRSTPYRVGAVRHGEPEITLQVWQTLDEPVDTAPQTMLITFDSSFAVPLVVAFDLDPHQVLALHAELGKVAAILAARNGER